MILISFKFNLRLLTAYLSKLKWGLNRLIIHRYMMNLYDETKKLRGVPNEICDVGCAPKRRRSSILFLFSLDFNHSEFTT